MSGTVTIAKVYKKLADIEKRLARVEKSIVPEVSLSKKELDELERIKADIRNGSYASECDLFAALSK